MSTAGHPGSPAADLIQVEAAELDLAVSRRWVVLAVQIGSARGYRQFSA